MSLRAYRSRYAQGKPQDNAEEQSNFWSSHIDHQLGGGGVSQRSTQKLKQIVFKEINRPFKG